MKMIIVTAFMLVLSAAAYADTCGPLGCFGSPQPVCRPVFVPGQGWSMSCQ